MSACLSRHFLLALAAEIQAQQQEIRDSMRKEFEAELADQLEDLDAEREKLASQLAQVCHVALVVLPVHNKAQKCACRKKTWKGLTSKKSKTLKRH